MTRETVTVMSYNVAGALSDGDKAMAVLDQVELHNPTVAVFPEAYRSGHDNIHEHVFEDLESMGYAFASVDQEVSDPRPDARGILVVAKKELVAGLGSIPLAGRYAIKADMYNPGTDKPMLFFGHHGNDKNEALRVEDLDALIRDYLPLATDADGHRNITDPTIYAGDGNTMRRGGVLPAALRAAGPFVRRLPSVEPNPDVEQSGLKRKASLAQRLSEMAIGDADAMLEEIGLRDIDPYNEPTMRKFGLAVKIDHIRASEHFDPIIHRVVQGITVDGDVNGEPLSDHDMLIGVVGQR